MEGASLLPRFLPEPSIPSHESHQQGKEGDKPQDVEHVLIQAGVSRQIEQRVVWAHASCSLRYFELPIAEIYIHVFQPAEKRVSWCFMHSCLFCQPALAEMVIANRLNRLGGGGSSWLEQAVKIQVSWGSCAGN